MSLSLSLCSPCRKGWLVPLALSLWWPAHDRRTRRLQRLCVIGSAALLALLWVELWHGGGAG